MQHGKPRIDLKIGGANIFIAPVAPGDRVNAAPTTPYRGLDHFGLAVTGIDAIAADLKASRLSTEGQPLNAFRAPLPAALVGRRDERRLLHRSRRQRAGAGLRLLGGGAGTRAAAKLLTRDEARRIAANIAKLLTRPRLNTGFR